MASSANLAKWLLQAIRNPLAWTSWPPPFRPARMRYTGDELRALRAERGVGRPPFKGEWNNWARGAQADQVNQMAAKWRWRQPQPRVWRRRDARA